MHLFFIGILMKNFLSIILSVLVFTGCSSVNFNERYANAKWDKIIIAPFTGDNAEIAEEEFEHALAVSNQVTVIPASMALLKMEEHSLLEKYKENPTKTIIELAEIMKADGIIIGKVESYSPKSSRSAQMVTTSASIYVKLVDAKDMSVVLSSQQKSSSMFSNSTSLLQDVSKSAIDELKEGFAKLENSN
jgi:PBP1b-binding outer membrane lipoprotein LpoB